MRPYLFSLLILSLLIIGCAQKAPEQAQQAPPQEVQQQQPVRAEGASQELQDLLSAKDNLEYQITYDVRTTVDGQEIKSTLIQYLDGANRYRTDTIVPGGIESRVYVLDGAATLCNKVNGRWSCQQGEAPDDVMAETDSNLMANTGSYGVTADGTMQVLGRTATCYKIDDRANQATIRYCFMPDGVPVYTSYTLPEATTEMTALLYGKDVAETVWAVPT